MSRTQRLALLALAVVVVVVAAVVVGSGAGSSKRTAGPVAIAVKGEQPVGGIHPIEVSKGQTVRFSVHSDRAEEIHVHGYDFHEDVPANGSASFAFRRRSPASSSLSSRSRAYRSRASRSIRETTRRAVLLVACVGALGAAWPAAASAHGLVGRADLPIPTWLFGYGAAGVLVVSFVGLAFLWPRPRLQSVPERRLVRLPVAVDFVCGLMGVATFLGVVVAGFAGTPTATGNIAPTFIYVIFWVALVPASVLFGDVFAAFNPWRAIARAARWTWPAITTRAYPAALPYPPRLGRWPAVVGIGGFAWLELIYADRTDPRILAGLALAYAVVQLVGMGLYGIEAWTAREDGFGVYFNLFSRLAPLTRRHGVLYARLPLGGAPRLELTAGTVALLCVMIGSTSYDGLESTTLWPSSSPHLEDAFSFLGRSGATEVTGSMGLLLMIGLVLGLYRLGVAGMQRFTETPLGSDLPGRFAHTLVPIAVAYVLAHYFSFLIFQGQGIDALVSDPLGVGSNFFGSANRQIDYNAISAAGIWYAQVAVLVVGHVGGLILAHDRAVALYPDPRQATRSQYSMLAVMVGFTGLALWLLASINA